MVHGRALNQFAMDEHGRLPPHRDDERPRAVDPTRRARLRARPEGDDLVTLGSRRAHRAQRGHPLGALRRRPRLRRHVQEDRSALRVRPLEPVRAADLGELKIPGFSTYMHMLDADHLLTIGYDADDHGSFAFFDGVMLQIFDVTDPTDPTLAHKHDHRHARLELRGADQPPRVHLFAPNATSSRSR